MKSSQLRLRATVSLIGLVALTSLTPLLHAQLTPLADRPVFDIQQVKPNIMFTLDNSGSMQSSAVPDSMNANGNRPCYMNRVANALYFNPAASYPPPKRADGTSYPNVSFTAAPYDGFGTSRPVTEVVNLATGFRPDCDLNGGGGCQNVSAPAGPARYTNYIGTAPAVPVLGTCYADTSYATVSVTTAQQQNFANWFSYYRTRMLATRTATGTAFASQDNSIRVGFHLLNNHGSGNFLGVGDFGSTHRDTWYSRLYGQSPNGITPSRSAAIRVGEYFRTGAMTGISGGTDPIQFSCQTNAHIYATDGFWNDNASPPPVPAGSPGERDDIVPTLPSPIPGLTAGMPWPNMYRHSTTALVGNEIKTHTLADIATYYWATDLRPTLANNVPASTDPDAGTNPSKDPANWQHLNYYGVSIAALGTKTFNTAAKSNNVASQPFLTALQSGTDRWPNVLNLHATGIDDLWHATVNSRGIYFNVSSAQELRDAIAAALADATSKGATAARAAVNNPELGVDSEDVAYLPSYRSGVWSGELTAKSINPDTGLPIADLWTHSSKLDAQDWNTGRRIITRNPVAAAYVPFRYASLSSTQQASLDFRPTATTTTRQEVLDYLRGKRCMEEGAVPSCGSLAFRKRNTALGDIIGSEGQVVGKPFERYSETYNPGYTLYKMNYASRTPMIYVGGNDGLIRAINGSASGTRAGVEEWAYVPSVFYRADNTGLGALPWKATDDIPYKFSHRYFANASGATRDVDFNRTSQSATAPTPNGAAGSMPNWKTVFITGLGKGGAAYVAFDVTNPPGTGDTETSIAASGRILWEFTHPDLGLTFGKPYIAKTARYGWVALLPGGYNNVYGTNLGKGIVFVVDVKTGTLLHTFNTGVGSAAAPAGLAHIEGLIPDETDFTVTELYAGDLQGNVWRFDVKTTTAWATTATKFAELKDASGNAQPITTVTRPSIDPVTATRYVFVGTGKLLDVSDVPCSTNPPPPGITCLPIPNVRPQSLYAIKDGSLYAPATTGLPRLRSALSNVARSSITGGANQALQGWVIDLPPGEVMVTEPIPNVGIVTFATSTPSTNPCDPGAFGTAYARVYGSGDSKVKTLGMPVPFFGGVAGSAGIAGIRFVRTRSTTGIGGNVVGTITTTTGNIASIDIDFARQFVGVGVNYREILN